jgi:hypothetical protein
MQLPINDVTSQHSIQKLPTPFKPRQRVVNRMQDIPEDFLPEIQPRPALQQTDRAAGAHA